MIHRSWWQKSKYVKRLSFIFQLGEIIHYQPYVEGHKCCKNEVN